MPRLLLLLPSSTYRTEDFMAAAARLGVEVTVASDFPSSMEPHNPGGLLALDFGAPERAALRAVEFARRYAVDAVLGVDDATVAPAAYIARALSLPHNPVDAVTAARNKYAARQLMERAGLQQPWYRLFDRGTDPRRAAGEVPYPCVVKPLVLSASRGVIRANDPNEFAEAFARLGAILDHPDVRGLGGDTSGILVESFIPGREVALEGLLTDGRLHPLCLFDKPDPLDGPFFEETLYVTPSRLPSAVQEAVHAQSERAAWALGLREGPLHAELRVNAAGPWLLEVNPRSIGGRCSRALRFGAGISLEEIILRQALRMELPSLERERQAAGVMMIPIPGPGILEAVVGQDEARAVPGVEEILITAHPGQELRPLPEGAPYLGFLFARGEAPGDVEAALRAAHGRLRILLRPFSPRAASGS